MNQNQPNRNKRSSPPNAVVAVNKNKNRAGAVVVSESDGLSDSGRGGKDINSIVSGGGSESTPTSSRDLSTSTSTTNNLNQYYDPNEIKDANRLFRLKLIVVSILILATAGIAASVYIVTNQSETQAFEETFDRTTNQIYNQFKYNIEQKLTAIQSLSISITSLASSASTTDSEQEEVWPNFVVSDFDIRASNTISFADGAAALTLSPIVPAGAQRQDWEDYCIDNTQWIQDSIEYQDTLEQQPQQQESTRVLQQQSSKQKKKNDIVNGISKQIYYYDLFAAAAGKNDTGGGELETYVDESGSSYSGSSYYVPVWQNFPVISNLVNLNYGTFPMMASSVTAAFQSAQSIVGLTWDDSDAATTFYETNVLEPWEDSTIDQGLTRGEPISTLFHPVFDILTDDDDTTSENPKQVVAILTLYVNWKTYFQQILSPSQATAGGIHVVVHNECDQFFTYKIADQGVTFLGYEDLHDLTYDSIGQTVAFQDLIHFPNLNNEFCPYSLSVFPTQEYQNEYTTNGPSIYTICVVIVFLLTLSVFFLYNCIVERRMNIVSKRVLQSRAIVSSLFPEAVRERMFRRNEDDSENPNNKSPKQRGEYTKSKIKSFLNTAPDSNKNNKAAAGVDIHNSNNNHSKDRPIADLFPHCTVFYADIAGFTKWSSERDPAQVFMLLQALYHSFDTLAKKRGVFKVETVGDCYVAVTGLPDPQHDHAIRMCKFAYECRGKMHELIQVLRSSLGEDTLDLGMRFGLHSGPVTAGVLRGEKSRFQLFGTTVSSAAHMEHTGRSDKIQVSQETADIITEAGKGHWLFRRIDDVETGGINTYWVEPQSHTKELKIKNALRTRISQNPFAPIDASHNSQRLIDWNVDLMKELLQRVVAARIDAKVRQDPDADFTISNIDYTMVRDEIKECLSLPKYDKTKTTTDPKIIQLDAKVETQLRRYVKMVASMYHDNPFHNFKHASNVCTNTNRLLGSVVDKDVSTRLSPSTHFACVYSALIHDLDHQGLTNMALIKEKPHIAALYKNQSVAEQNSVDLAFNLLMDTDFEDLQLAIFCNEEEFKRFRSIVVNVVMATDIFDPSLKADRMSRWDKAFVNTNTLNNGARSELRATVIIENVMQLADIYHTMQNFHCYKRWNERLFEEMYMAYSNGTSDRDPSTSWFQGEVWFFDNYVLPLALRIQQSKVFGVQGDDCVNNAIANKKEWAVEGDDIMKDQVNNVLEKIRQGQTGKVAMKTKEANKSEEKVQDLVMDKPKKKDADNHLIQWNADLLKRKLRQILAYRMANGVETKKDLLKLSRTVKEGSVIREEMEEIIDFPDFDREASKRVVDPATIELSQAVEDQLRDYVEFVSAMSPSHEYHNFKHVSNMTTECSRYLQRVVDDKLARKMSHPVVQFTVLFASLVSDLDHPGVSNAQLVKENSRIAVVHHNKSMAEQNSLELAYSVLIEPDYKDLLDAICANEQEFLLFRKILINSVMATDLFDEELINERNKRFAKAFDVKHRDPSLSQAAFQNLRATVTVEHIMQAADISHCLQHFNVFLPVNRRRFFEAYAAFDSGRIDEDPSESWYKNELQFFDNTVLPLARKFDRCGMFGKAGDDAVRFAAGNRKDWVLLGSKIVEEFKRKYRQAKADGNIKATF